jgi:outer membrane protein insertion porin family
LNNLKIFFSIILLSFNSFLFAEIVDDINIKGIQRVEPGVIFDSIPFDIGDDLKDLNPSDIIKYVYKTGQFRDVSVEFEDGILTVVVSEKPIISSIEFKGNQLIQEDKLREGIRQVNLYE